MLRRTRFVVLLVLILAGCGPRGAPLQPDSPALSARVDRALSRGARFLVSRQSADGAWRSDVYGQFKEGDALTPLVLTTLLSLPPDESLDDPCRRAASFLAAMVTPDGHIESRFGLTYPVYTSALTVIALSDPRNREFGRARDAWLAYLCERQLTEERGWQRADPEYGGWGFSPDVPRKPASDAALHPLTIPNLSATACAVEALRAAGRPADDPSLRKALVFVERCQNFASADRPQPRFDDGGFFFIRGDTDRNKAGVAGKDAAGRERYYSYGSTTADGLCCLLACGVRDGPRVSVARSWLERHFRADTHPGTFAEDHEHKRSAVYFYYCEAVARALRGTGVEEVTGADGKVRWAEALARELVELQGKEGGWINPNSAVREDDPIVATSLALRALATCRSRLRD
ncbi:MAG TPA: prenyltransferase/squalene oxidase repeat-containing protein [Gemmataceae bacterium]|nr:prenyltransferase/squalene oxidase repeat-containing protein [Gemmataceae bacterium]